jgi:DNA-binding NtrC family response regulator
MGLHPMKTARLLIVDAKPASDASYRQALSELDSVELVFEHQTEAACKRLQEQSFKLLIVAHAPPAVDALALLSRAREIDADLGVVLIEESPTLSTATTGLRLGAADYLTGKLAMAELATTVHRLLGRPRLEAEYALLKRQVERPYSFDDIIGASPAMRKVFETIEQVADSDVDVLVHGETGTGKELIARSIHRRSRRASGPFVPVDCGAIPDSLLESEFFGHEKGAFTGADNRRIGLMEFANHGTLFLDELGELPLVMQAKLLRTLQERKIRRLGGHDEIGVDLRVVAATARVLDEMIRQESFRQDLYYRINVVRIDLPPLRERGDDIGLLAEYLVNRYTREMGRDIRGITPEAYQVFSQYRWPGNIRELQNVIRRGIALAKGTMIDVDDLPDDVVIASGENRPDGPAGFFVLRDRELARFEQDYLRELLKRHQGDVRTAAREAKLPRGTLYRLMKKYGLDGASFR